MENAGKLREELLAAVDAASDLASLDAVRVDALGKKGRITSMMKGLGGLDPDERKAMGQALNQVKGAVADAIEAKKAAMETAALNTRLMDERVDVTLTPRPEPSGRIHPISQTIEEIVAILGEMGFQVVEGPDIEDDWHNFTALNIPEEHPARQEHDTFYLPAAEGADAGAAGDRDRFVLRTHTSPVQVRTMQAGKPPFRVIVPGRTYRSDYDATHSPMFHQVEGLLVDEHTHMGHLKGCLQDFCRAFFGVEDLPVRFRPSYFPFTEPSAEVDIGYVKEGASIRIGRAKGEDQRWLEVLGSGMVNPRVLENCGVDTTTYQGFAFGMGVERLAMLKYGIPDLRTFYESDLRWLRHYGFASLDQPSLVGGLNR